MGARNQWVIQTTSTIVLTFSLVLVGILFTLIKSSQLAAQKSQQNVKLELFFKDDLKVGEDNSWLDQLKNFPEVLDLSIITRQQAQNEFRKIMEPSLGSLTEEATLLSRLPSSMIVRFQDGVSVETKKSIVDEIVKLAQQTETFDGHIFQAAWAQWLQTASYQAEKAFLGLISLIGIIFFLIISNIVRGQVSHRQDEIEIRSFLGSTIWQIEKPFIVNSIAIGILSSLLSTMITVGLIRFSKNNLSAVSDLVSSDLIAEPNGFEILILAFFVALVSAWAAHFCVRERVSL